MWHRRLALALLATVVAGCLPGEIPSPTPRQATVTPAGAGPTMMPVELTILAAASLKKVLDKVKTVYESAHPGATLVVSTDSSSALETKIEQGAPCDVFLSADAANPQKLVDGGFATGDAVVFAGNELAIIVPADNPAGITSPFDLARPGVDIVAALDTVPITRYAKQLVANLAASPGAPAGFAAAYAANVASREDNVGAIVGKLELGQGDAGIVYVTDAKSSTKLKTIDVTPKSANVPATYAGVVVKASTSPGAAKAFLEWIAGADGQAILASFGFLPPSS
jgi:molybdate transport system substrate-binding protein